MKDDYRYKVSQEQIDMMRRQRRDGLTFQAIADYHGVSYGTAYYWINHDFRTQHRKRSAKRRHSKGDTARINRTVSKAKQNRLRDPKTRLRHSIQSAKDETRAERKSVQGMQIKEARKLLDSGKLNRKNRKMRD